MDEVKDVNEVLINNNMEIIKLSDEEKIEKLIGSIKKLQKSLLLSNFLKELDEYMKRKKIVMNPIIKKIVEDAIIKVNEIESNEDLTTEEKKNEVNIVLEETKKVMTNLENIFLTSLQYVNDLLDYAIIKQPKNNDFNEMKVLFNLSKTDKELKDKIGSKYNDIIPLGKAKIYNKRMIDILMTYGFTKEELETINKKTINEGLLDNMLIKVDNYSLKIKKFINKKDDIIEGENKLLNNIDNLITERTLMDNNEGIEKYREKIVAFYNKLQKMQGNKQNIIDDEENILYGLDITELPELSKNNIMKMISKIYDVYLGNISYAMSNKKLKTIVEERIINDVKQLIKDKKSFDDDSTQATESGDISSIPKKKNLK